MEDETKTDQAIALKYQSEEELPEIIARGLGEAAHRIEQIALKNGVPVEKNLDAVSALSRLNVGEAINQESFPMIAEVIAFLYHVDSKWREEHTFLNPVLGDDPF